MSNKKSRLMNGEKDEADAIKLIVCNLYLIPWFYVTYLKVGGDPYSVSNCARQEARAKEFVDYVVNGKFDLAIIQETWGGASDVILKSFEKLVIAIF